MAVIVGCPRSGTSLFADLLTAAGLHTTDDPRRGPGYPAGYHEHMPILMFNKAIERLHGPHQRITRQPFLKSEYLADPFVHRMFEAAYQPLLDHTVDFIKNPHLALSVDFLFERFSPIHVIALWRDPCATFRSLVLREFSRSTLPVSGLHAIFLWNMYAWHITEAKRKHPENVTILNIDDLVNVDADLTPLLRALGHPARDPVTVDQCMNRQRWNRRVSWRWRMYFAMMNASSRIISPRLTEDRRGLADIGHWRSRLREMTSSLADL